MARREGTISGLCQNTYKVTPFLEVSVAKQSRCEKRPLLCELPYLGARFPLIF